MTHSYEYDVQMPCGGCASAVRTAVTALSDVQSVETSVEKQKVNVIVADDVTFDQVKLVIQNAGKQVKGGRVIEGKGVIEMPVQAAAVN
ncbi:hypothetical protein FOYG_17142 [Fusarium oxysporum NRRL 32931]|uniref:HMA domain-containing protein n=1 Tax=Fusarium oxysporum NRRL 32931 TaxID=660029 RepID=W9HB11_FUSOX|nr:hypothetical protein FOYG_17142 [Fusarium oxysporum NRRL 32931]